MVLGLGGGYCGGVGNCWVGEGMQKSRCEESEHSSNLDRTTWTCCVPVPSQTGDILQNTPDEGV